MRACLLALTTLAALRCSAENCDEMPGAWKGCEGGSCPDTYAVTWRGAGAPAFWVNTTGATHELWTYAECSLGAGNATASCYFPERNVWLSGPATSNCRVLSWNNTSVFSKDINTTISRVHLLFASHLDVGFTGLINEVHNSYVASHFPRALALVQAMENRSATDRFRYLTHPWLLSLFFHCPQNFTLSGVTLQCPSADAVSAMRAALGRGDIFMHAAPFNVEWETVAFPEMGAAYFSLARNLSLELGVPPPRTASSRDVPGVTRGVLPLLNAAGITRLSEGVNGATTPPAMASPAVWRDAASGAQVLYVQHNGGYGAGGGHSPLRRELRVPLGPLRDGQCTLLYGWDEALCFDWRGEGQGPPDSVEEVVGDYAAFRRAFPQAQVFASSFEEYFDALEAVAGTLPIITSENGDSWINGVAGDPQKVALYRTAASAFAACSRAGACDLSDARIAAFARWLLKTPEHTWGLPAIGQDGEYIWGNADLAAARKSLPNFMRHDDSYIEQRNVTAVYALAALEDHPLAAEIAARWAEAQPAPPAPGADYVALPPSAWTLPLLVALPGGGNVSLTFDGAAGGLTALSVNGSTNLAQPAHPLAALLYRQFNGSDWGAASTCPLAYARDGDDAAGAASASTRAVMDALYAQTGGGPRSFLVHASFPEVLVLEAGAPQSAWVKFTVGLAGDVRVDVQLFNKTSTRFGEAVVLEWLFAPQLPAALGNASWRIDKLGTWVDPLDVVAGGSTQQHSAGVGVGLWGAAGGPSHGKGLFLDTLDAPVLAVVTEGSSYSLLPTRAAPLTDAVTGWASILFTNAWAMVRLWVGPSCADGNSLTPPLCFKPQLPPPPLRIIPSGAWIAITAFALS